MEVNSLPTSDLCRLVPHRLSGCFSRLQVNFGPPAEKMNWLLLSGCFLFISLFKKAKVAWLTFWMDIPGLTGQPIWLFFGRGAEDCGYPPAHHQRCRLSTRVHQEQPCCHILQLSFWRVLIHPRSDSWYFCNLCIHSIK